MSVAIYSSTDSGRFRYLQSHIIRHINKYLTNEYTLLKKIHFPHFSLISRLLPIALCECVIYWTMGVAEEFGEGVRKRTVDGDWDDGVAKVRNTLSLLMFVVLVATVSVAVKEVVDAAAVANMNK